MRLREPFTIGRFAFVVSTDWLLLLSLALFVRWTSILFYKSMTAGFAGWYWVLPWAAVTGGHFYIVWGISYQPRCAKCGSMAERRPLQPGDPRYLFVCPKCGKVYTHGVRTTAPRYDRQQQYPPLGSALVDEVEKPRND